MRNVRLKQELREAGADKAEAARLANLAKDFANLDIPKLDNKAKQAMARDIGFSPRGLRLPEGKLALAGSFAALVTVILVAQSSQPGSVLYAVKRGSEEVRVRVQPSYTDDLVERRKAELDRLKEGKSDNKKLIEAEKEYIKSLKRADKGDERDKNGSGKDDEGRGSDDSGSGRVEHEENKSDDSSGRDDNSGSGDDSD